jgi:hypothetical protein
MKKNILLTLCFLAVSIISFAGKFVLIPVNETQNLESLFDNKDLKIHYYENEFVIATTNNFAFSELVVLDDNAFADVSSYVLLYNVNASKDAYLSKVAETAKILYSGNNFLIMKVETTNFSPDVNDKISTIKNIELSFPKSRFDFPVVTEIDPFVQSILDKVSTDTLLAYVQHLQDYGTRAYNEPKAFQAQDWMKSKFESWRLDVEVQNFSVTPWEYWGWQYYPHATSSGNVIAVQKGTKYPDEYIVCGAHYDSWSWYNAGGGFAPNKDIAPGADDNATGTASILELARVMSQYDSERTIVYCAFAAEEFGLHGSEAYAKRCNQQGMNILGYFNIDMSGYLAPGAPRITISLIRKPLANPLANYYTNITNVYFPEVYLTHHSSMSGGDSDHTSFANYNYQGIYPFENNDAYSPFIHKPTDVIGSSVNNSAQMGVYAKATLAGMATLALLSTPPPPIVPPINCVANNFFEQQIIITWDAPEENTPEGYFVYRDSVRIFEDPITTFEYYDTPEVSGDYCYNVTAVYGEIESEFSNESCAESFNNIIEYSSKFKIYPNPARDELRITNYELRSGIIDFFDITGKKISSHHLISSSSHQTINVSHLSSGIYFIKISNELVGKFIKE